MLKLQSFLYQCIFEPFKPRCNLSQIFNHFHICILNCFCPYFFAQNAGFLKNLFGLSSAISFDALKSIFGEYFFGSCEGLYQEYEIYQNYMKFETFQHSDFDIII